MRTKIKNKLRFFYFLKIFYAKLFEILKHCIFAMFGMLQRVRSILQTQKIPIDIAVNKKICIYISDIFIGSSLKIFTTHQRAIFFYSLNEPSFTPFLILDFFLNLTFPSICKSGLGPRPVNDIYIMFFGSPVTFNAKISKMSCVFWKILTICASRVLYNSKVL